MVCPVGIDLFVINLCFRPMKHCHTGWIVLSSDDVDSMNTDLITTVTDLGFSTIDSERVVSGVIVNADYSFRLFIDTKAKTFNLTIIHDVLERDLLSFQGFSDVDELKRIILNNHIFTRHRW